MSKAEEKSREYVLPFLDKHYKKYGEHEQMELSRFDGYDMMSSYEEGYHQAEKDMELTNADVYDIWRIYNEVCAEGKIFGFDETSQEVLKRFKTEK